MERKLDSEERGSKADALSEALKTFFGVIGAIIGIFFLIIGDIFFLFFIVFLFLMVILIFPFYFIGERYGWSFDAVAIMELLYLLIVIASLVGIIVLFGNRSWKKRHLEQKDGNIVIPIPKN